MDGIGAAQPLRLRTSCSQHLRDPLISAASMTQSRALRPTGGTDARLDTTRDHARPPREHV